MADFRKYQDIIDDMRMTEETEDAIIPADCPCTNTYDDVQQALRICPACGNCMIIVTYQNDYKDHRGVKRSYQPYKRLNHFVKNLNSIRKKRNVAIPQTILHFVKRKCKTITSNNIRNVLKASKLTKYIPHIHQIYETLTNKQVPYLYITEFLELIRLFKQIDGVYNGVQKNRIQFFNYNFLIRKLLDKIGRKDCVDFFKPLKNQTRYEYQTKLYHTVMNMVSP
jgi:hypothetical protein